MKKIKLETATSVFDGWDNIPVPIKDAAHPLGQGRWQPIDPDSYIAVKGNSELELPDKSFRWEAGHGCTGWYVESFGDKMFEDTVYLVPKEWYEEVCK
jgi:hypothetical protein